MSGRAVPAVPVRVVALGGALLLASGCASGPDPLAGPRYVTHSCTSEAVLDDWWSTGVEPGPEPELLVDEATAAPFEPVAVVLCEVDAELDDGGNPTALVVTETRSTGDLGAVLRYLSQPSPPQDDAHPTCASIGAPAPSPEVWLVDADGRAVDPRLPTDRCGMVRGGLEDAVAGLDAAAVEHRLPVPAGLED